MTIYQYEATVTTASGASSSSTLDVIGGILGHVIIQANTSTTTFRTRLLNAASDNIVNWGFSTGELNDTSIKIPIAGKYIINIPNASPDDSFKVKLSVEEGK